jgi:hypothetical protein
MGRAVLPRGPVVAPYGADGMCALEVGRRLG